MLLPTIREIHNERHYKNKIFFIKWMINTLCNMFPSKFGEKYQVCGGHMSVFGEKKVPLTMTTSMQF
jgi:hypothetical protein